MVDSGSSGGDSGIPLMGVVGMPTFLVWGGAERWAAGTSIDVWEAST